MSWRTKIFLKTERILEHKRIHVRVARRRQPSTEGGRREEEKTLQKENMGEVKGRRKGLRLEKLRKTGDKVYKADPKCLIYQMSSPTQ